MNENNKLTKSQVLLVKKLVIEVGRYAIDCVEKHPLPGVPSEEIKKITEELGLDD